MTPAVAAPSAAETKPANTTAPTVAGDIPHDNNFTGKKVEVEEPTHAADERIAKDLKDGKPVVVAKHGKAKVEHEKKADAEKPKAEKKAVVKHAAKGKGDSVAAQKARDLRYHKDHPNDPNWQMVK